MNINVFSVLALLGGMLSLPAQTTPVPAPQPYPGQTYPARSYPSQAYPYSGYANTNQLTAAGPTFSNGAGQNFTPAQLATQLQNLRSAIAQTLPMLSAFNAQYSNSIAGSQPTAGGTLSGIVSDVLHRNQPAGRGYGSSQGSLNASNLLSMLHGLLNRNTPTGSQPSPSEAQDLYALQNDLQPVDNILQRLNVSPTPVQTTPYPQPYPGGYPAPTGR